MKMTYTEIKNALSEGKTLFRVGKNKSTTEVRMIDNKPVRRYISEAGEPTAWSATALNTMPKYEWESKESEELPPSELTAPVTRQVQLGDGTSTIVTEYVPISEAPVVIDPFAIPLTKDNDTPEPEPEVIPEPIPEPVQEDVTRHIPEVEEKAKVTEGPMDAIAALKAMEEGEEVVWIPLEEDHGLQAKFYRDWDGKFMEVRANCSHTFENIDMNQFLSHTYLRVEGDLHPFFTALSMVTSYGPRCFIRNIITGKVIRGPNYSDDPDETYDDYPIEPLEVGTISPTELRTFWVIDFEEVDDE